MKIALVHYRVMHVGGLESRLFNYARWFSDHGHEVTLLTYKADPGVQLPPNVILKVLPVRWVPKPLRGLWFDRLLRKEFQQAAYDFILSLGRTSVHDALIVAGTHLGYLTRMGKTRMGISDIVQVKLDRMAYAGKGMLFPSSQQIAEEMQTLYQVPRERIEVLFPPVDTKRFHPERKRDRAMFRQKYGFPEGKTVFLFVSSNHALKGLPLLLRVFANLKNADVMLAVAGPQDPGELPANVRYLGHVLATEELYAAADFLILASAYESFGQVVGESLLCGTPVIVSDTTGASAIVGPQEGVIVSGFGLREWTDAVCSAPAQHFDIRHDRIVEALDLDAHMRRMLAGGSDENKGRR